MTRSARNTIGLRIVVVVAMLVAIVPAGMFATAGGGPSPGSDGLGDSYFPLTGNGGYDVGHYHLDLRYAPATDKLFGRVTITATATQALSSFNLDFVGMHIGSLTVDGGPATWNRAQHQELIVTPASPIADGAGFVVDVEYDGVPKSPLSYGARAGAVRTDDGVLIYGEPDVAAYWYPSNDHPRDKATFTIDLTVPEGLKAISNGRLLGHTPDGKGRVTWSWEEMTPMATYLAMAVIGRFKIDRYETEGGIPVLDAVDPRVSENASRSLAKEARVIRFLEDHLGTYPFDDLGGIVDKWQHGFALENQTRPIYPPSAFSRGPNAYLIVHELAHQWFGDSVALDEWQHMWLNEGFASYAEWLWSGEKGDGTPQRLLSAWCGIPAQNRFWDVAPGDPGVDNLFAYQVYARGAMTLQALRKTVGTATFFEIVHTWLADHADSTGSTDQFIALSETVSGQQLDPLFDAWLFTPEKPTPCAVGGSTRGISGPPPLPAVFGGGRS
jgi:aminopeptidase N